MFRSSYFTPSPELQANLPHCRPDSPDEFHPVWEGEEEVFNSSAIKFPVTTENYAVGMARTSKLDFAEALDLGVPLDLPKKKDSDVLLVYGHEQALPDDYRKYHKMIPALEVGHALEHCDFVNIVLTDHSASRNQCLAIVPQYESYHIQKWMRMAPAHGGRGDVRGLDPTQDLQYVSRGMQKNGRDQFSPPKTQHIQQNWALLVQYFSSYQESLAELKPLVEKVATKKKTVTVMVSNFGQSELLTNFVCAAQARDLDTSSILVFATDVETKELAERLGLTAFYDERVSSFIRILEYIACLPLETHWSFPQNFGSMPSEAAGHYGDTKFTMMMMAKVICVQMVSALKYSILFQDVDIVWYKDPVKFFENTHEDFDLLFQDDGGHSVRYAPYSANSGFYYVRYNARTEYFFSSLLLAGDLILKTDSHQQALIALLSEHVSLYGLKVKVFSRDEEEFPGGYHFHQKSGAYMKKMFAGDVEPYIFHMSWTLNKQNKLLFLRQMGEWWVVEDCIHSSAQKVTGLEDRDSCCAAEPLISCHYRDKPSIIPCKDSPPIDAGKSSFWK